MLARLLVLPLACLGLAACFDTAPLLPANQLAQAGGTPVLHFARGLPGGAMKIVMPDGEVLPGTFRIDEAFYQTTPGHPPANFHAHAAGPTTRLSCEGTVVAGHGKVPCRTQTGAEYVLEL